MWTRANPHPFRNSAAVGAIAYLALLLLAAAAGRLTAETSGRLLFDAAFPTLVVAFIARVSGSTWRWWVYALAVTGGVLAIILMTVASALQATTN